MGDHHVDRRQVQGARALQPSRTKGPCGLTGPTRGRSTALSFEQHKPAAHAGATSRVKRLDATLLLHPTPHPDLYGRWLWRGGSTRSHPELGSENPLRGWYCRGHPVGEYGAAGLSLDHARFDSSLEAGVGLFVAELYDGPHAETRRRRGRNERGRVCIPLLPSFSPSASLRLCVRRSSFPVAQRTALHAAARRSRPIQVHLGHARGGMG